jgi:hypothetical protein
LGTLRIFTSPGPQRFAAAVAAFPVPAVPNIPVPIIPVPVPNIYGPVPNISVPGVPVPIIPADVPNIPVPAVPVPDVAVPGDSPRSAATSVPRRTMRTRRSRNTRAVIPGPTSPPRCSGTRLHLKEQRLETRISLHRFKGRNVSSTISTACV